MIFYNIKKIYNLFSLYLYSFTQNVLNYCQTYSFKLSIIDWLIWSWSSLSSWFRKTLSNHHNRIYIIIINLIQKNLWMKKKRTMAILNDYRYLYWLIDWLINWSDHYKHTYTHTHMIYTDGSYFSFGILQLVQNLYYSWRSETKQRWFFLLISFLGIESISTIILPIIICVCVCVFGVFIHYRYFGTKVAASFFFYYYHYLLCV